MVKMHKSNILSVDKDVDQRALSDTAVRNANWFSHLGKPLTSSGKAKDTHIL